MVLLKGWKEDLAGAFWRQVDGYHRICASCKRIPSWQVVRLEEAMKIEANPTPEQIKWLILVALIAAGLGHEQILGLLA